MAELKDWAKPKAGQTVDDEFKFLRIGNDGRWYWRDLEEGNTFSTTAGIKNSNELYDAFLAFQEKPFLEGGLGRDLTAAAGVGSSVWADVLAKQEQETRDEAHAERLKEQQDANRQARLKLALAATGDDADLPTGQITPLDTGTGLIDPETQEVVDINFDTALADAAAKARSYVMNVAYLDPTLGGSGDLRYVPKDWRHQAATNKLIPREVVAWWYHAVAKDNAARLGDRVKVEGKKLSTLQKSLDTLLENPLLVGTPQAIELQKDIARQTALTDEVNKRSSTAKRFQERTVNPSIKEFLVDPSVTDLAIPSESEFNWNLYSPEGMTTGIDSFMQKWDQGYVPPTPSPAATKPPTAAVTGKDAFISNEDLETQYFGSSGDPTKSAIIKTANGAAPTAPTLEQIIANAPLAGSATGGFDEFSGFTPEQRRQMALERQYPSEVFSRMGLGGELAQGISTEDLAPLVVSGLQNYYRQQLEPGYAMELARQSQALPMPAGGAAFDPSGLPAVASFEDFARQRLGGVGTAGQELGGQAMQPGAFDTRSFIETLEDRNRVTDPYRAQLMEYLGGQAKLEGSAGLENERLMNLLNAPTLSRISPLYRRAAAEQMTGALQRRMTMQPERGLFEFYTGRTNPNPIGESAFTMAGF